MTGFDLNRPDCQWARRLKQVNFQFWSTKLTQIGLILRYWFFSWTLRNDVAKKSLRDAPAQAQAQAQAQETGDWRLETGDWDLSFYQFELKAVCEFIELIWIKSLFYYALVMSIKSFVYEWSMKFLMVFIWKFCSLKLMNRPEKSQWDHRFSCFPRIKHEWRWRSFKIPKAKDHAN